MNEINLSEYIGAKIRYYRNELGLTQDDLAKKLNTTKATISNYETGYRTPKQDNLFDLAKVLQVSIDDLFPETNTKKKNESKIETIYAQLNPDLQKLLLKEAESHLQQQMEKEHSSKVISMENKQENREKMTLAAHDTDANRNITEDDINNVHDYLDRLDAKYDKKNNIDN